MKKIVFGICVIIFSFNVAFAQSPFGDPPQNPENPGVATDPGSNSTPIEPTDSGQSTSIGTVQNTGSTGGVPTNENAGKATKVQSSGLLPVAQNSGGAQFAGSGLNAGNGTNTSFWQYLLSLLNGGTLNGQNFQTLDRNQETKVTSNGQADAVLDFKNQWSPPTPVKTISYKGPNYLNCGFSQSNKTLGGYIGMATCLMFYLIPIIIALLVLWFMFGSIKYINDSEHEERGQYKVFLTWGVIILFVALSFVGILRLMSKTLGI